VKTTLKGKRFLDIEDIRKYVPIVLNAALFDAFDDCFVQLTERCKMYVAIKRGNFEGK
jgi:hypothetical protein